MKSFFAAIGIMVAIVVAVPLGILAIISSMYNGLQSADEHVRQTYSQVQNVMQRQADLLPNLVETVKGTANFESSTLIKITEARAKLSAVAKMDPKELAANPELQKQVVEAQSANREAIQGLAINVEAYPQLKSNSAFMSLMTEISGSQNRITTERRRNQLAVEDWNSRVRKVPGAWVASYNGYETKPYYEAEAGAQKPPQVKF